MKPIETVVILGKPVPFNYSGIKPDTPNRTSQLIILDKMVRKAEKVFDFSMCQVKYVELHLSVWQEPVLYVWTHKITDRAAYYDQDSFIKQALYAPEVFTEIVTFFVNVKEY